MNFIILRIFFRKYLHISKIYYFKNIYQKIFAYFKNLLFAYTLFIIKNFYQISTH